MSSVDTVQPNAPGTQGDYVSAYPANNPTTGVDPSGHFVGSLPSLVMTAMLAGVAGPRALTSSWTIVRVTEPAGSTDPADSTRAPLIPIGWTREGERR